MGGGDLGAATVRGGAEWAKAQRQWGMVDGHLRRSGLAWRRTPPSYFLFS
jgi:hypothetical protein